MKINENMAKTFGVNSRILGYDSHIHGGKTSHHVHVLQKTKSKGYLPSPSTLSYNKAYSLFTQIPEEIIKRYAGK